MKLLSLQLVLVCLLLPSVIRGMVIHSNDEEKSDFQDDIDLEDFDLDNIVKINSEEINKENKENGEIEFLVLFIYLKYNTNSVPLRFSCYIGRVFAK